MILGTFNFAFGENVDPTAPLAPDTCTCDSPKLMKIDSPSDGTYTDGTLEVEITNFDSSNGLLFDFTSNIKICGVWLKGGNTDYDYTKASGYQEVPSRSNGQGNSKTGTLFIITEDSYDNLMLGQTALDIQDKQISHITFYYCESQEPPTGSITINKNITNSDLDDTQFDVTVTGPESYTTVVAVSEGNSVTLDNLIMGAYTFYEVVPPGYTGVVTAGSLTLTPGALDKSFTFVNKQNTGSIHIIKNIEVEDEAVHEEVRFNLSSLSNGSGVLSGYTDSNGELMFNNLLAGNYFLEEILPLDFETTYTTQVAVTIGQTTEVKVLNNMVENPADQFVYNGSSIYGYKYKYNAMEEGLEGWTIELYEEGNTTTPLATTVTDSDGFYEFNGVDEGVYVIKEVMQSEWYNITPIQQTITIGGVGFDE